MTHKFDDKSNVVESVEFKLQDSLETKWSYKYSYDKKGNWTKQIKFKNEFAKYIIEREIVYYD